MTRRIAILGFTVVAALGCGRSPSAGSASGADGAGGTGGARHAVGGQPASVADGGTGAPVVPAVDTRPTTVRIFVRSAGPKMQVSWGRRQLGTTPLSLRRPRDSGPMDLVLRADNYFPVHVRAYTFRDDTIVARPTLISDRMRLVGARKELPPEDGGVSRPEDGPRPPPGTVPPLAPSAPPPVAPSAAPPAAPTGGWPPNPWR